MKRIQQGNPIILWLCTICFKNKNITQLHMDC